MKLLKTLKNAAKSAAFGDTLVPLEFTLGLTEPQIETAVWLHGLGAPRDVTYRYSTACCAPLMLCLAVDRAWLSSKDESPEGPFTLTFTERCGKQQVLGRITLSLTETITIDGLELLLFRATSSANYCLPLIRRWAHWISQARQLRKNASSASLKMSFEDFRASHITFIRPHPLALVSAIHGAEGNLFPMNLMGELGSECFGLALRHDRMAATLVESAGRVAISGVPFELGSIAYGMANNHRNQSIDWDALPFPLRRSKLLGLPVPEFASRVRELEIAKTVRLGSHIFFIAKVLSDESFGQQAQINVIHGFYRWRQMRGHGEELKRLIEEDTRRKGSWAKAHSSPARSNAVGT